MVKTTTITIITNNYLGNSYRWDYEVNRGEKFISHLQWNLVGVTSLHHQFTSHNLWNATQDANQLTKQEANCSTLGNIIIKTLSC